jgi:hypothetical protein
MGLLHLSAAVASFLCRCRHCVAAVALSPAMHADSTFAAAAVVPLPVLRAAAAAAAAVASAAAVALPCMLLPLL